MAFPTVPCPVCGRRGAPFPSESVTICDECGDYVRKTAPRLLLVNPSSYLTFCSPACLRRRLSANRMFTSGGISRRK